MDRRSLPPSGPLDLVDDVPLGDEEKAYVVANDGVHKGCKFSVSPSRRRARRVACRQAVLRVQAHDSSAGQRLLTTAQIWHERQHGLIPGLRVS